MTKTRLYIIRHGKTMFNTISRAQGWCDTPLTQEGEQGIHYLGQGLKDIDFQQAFSSDSGRAIQTCKIILAEHSQGASLTHTTDQRIREWCFGSLEGGYNAEMWGVIPRVLDFDQMQMDQISFEEIADALYAADTANWAEPYAKIRQRVWDGFTDIAKQGEEAGGGNLLVVSHGLTIAFLLHLIDSNQPIRPGLANGSVNIVDYENGIFTIQTINNIDYIEKGRQSV